MTYYLPQTKIQTTLPMLSQATIWIVIVSLAMCSKIQDLVSLEVVITWITIWAAHSKMDKDLSARVIWYWILCDNNPTTTTTTLTTSPNLWVACKGWSKVWCEGQVKASNQEMEEEIRHQTPITLAWTISYNWVPASRIVNGSPRSFNSRTLPKHRIWP